MCDLYEGSQRYTELKETVESFAMSFKNPDPAVPVQSAADLRR